MANAGLTGIRSSSGLTAEFVSISPEIAATMLKRAEGKNFRKQKESHVHKMSCDMKDGLWRFDGSPLRLNRNGILIDGQNRLRALIVADRTLEFLVVRNVDDSTMVDGEIEKRVLGEHLANLGCPHYQVASSITRAAYKHSIGRTGNRDGKHIGGLANWLKFYEDNAIALQESTEVAAGSSLIPKSMMGCLHFVLAKHDLGEKAIAFRDRVTKRTDANGVLLDPEDPAAALNSKLRLNRDSKSKLRHNDGMAYVIKAWNFWIQGVRIKRLVYASSGDRIEPFPEILTREDGDE